VRLVNQVGCGVEGSIGSLALLHLVRVRVTARVRVRARV